MGCCNTNTKNDTAEDTYKETSCPKCGDKGTTVDLITPQSLLNEDKKEKIRPNLDYKYCKNAECEVAYFTKDDDHFFLIHDLKEKATVKDKGLDVKVCYCFGHSRQSVLSELKATGNSTVLESIKSKMKDPGCFCEVSNPQGACCLGNVMAWIKEAKTIINEG
jgi:hypothetical protein